MGTWQTATTVSIFCRYGDIGTARWRAGIEWLAVVGGRARFAPGMSWCGPLADMPIPTAMNTSAISSAIRHTVTSLAALGGYLAAHGLINAGDVATVNAAGLTLSNALTAIGTALIARLMIYLAGVVFGKGVDSASASLLVLGCMGMALSVIGLSSCNPYQLSDYKAIASAVPITVGGTYHGLRAVYNTQTGVTIWYDAEGKPVAKATPPQVVPSK